MTSPLTAPPRGWYRDPESPEKWRFWDGASWYSATVPFPETLSPRDLVPLAREARRAQWLYVPVALALLAIVAIALAQLPLHPEGSDADAAMVYIYPVWHIFLARSTRVLASTYGITVRRGLRWVPIVGPLLWWHLLGRILNAPLWARLAPLWCGIGIFGAVAIEPVQRVVVASAWILGVMGSIVVVRGFRRAVLIDTQRPVAP